MKGPKQLIKVVLRDLIYWWYVYQTLVQINTKYAEKYFCSHSKVFLNVFVSNSIDFDCDLMINKV